MKKLFFIDTEDSSNLKNRQLTQQQNIIRCLSQSDTAFSIPEIADYIKTSVPTGTKLIKDLIDNRFIKRGGKKETVNGRRPTTYTLNKEKFYIVGVEVLEKFIHASIVRIDMETKYETLNRSFRLEDSLSCLKEITVFIKSTLKESGIKPSQCIGIGVGLTGSVNGHSGKSIDYFNETGISLKKYLESKLKLPVILDNDTRAIAAAEQVVGMANGVENVLVVKVSRQAGLSVILNRKTIIGGAGLAGNFAHIRFKEGNRLCSCGKTGCIGTEVGGDALKNDLAEALSNGQRSLHFHLDKIEDYQYHDILDAVLKGDALSIQLLHKQGDKLGQALGNIVNLLNPDMIVIGGEFVMVKDFLLDAVKIGIKKTALLDSLMSCRIEASTLGRYLSSKAGVCLLLKTGDLIEY